ncbi:hypothetical protein DSL72_009220 [Monilinia vaccinii-corymbosi]|uniref:Uncharacterized protein n=1 Tax=Monilinia vaccinii-corymbosi TaxID=61207 RepID=A0A8A3PNR6_9HELO|nr:hypothetical protein DSL72_009220 [Monilinia vaccinii-corymbosi]
MASVRSYNPSSYFTPDGGHQHQHQHPSCPSAAEIARSHSSPPDGPPGMQVNTPSQNKTTPIPIAIQKSSRKRVYTPLTGRGELPGGYFPGFADHPETLEPANLSSTSRSRDSPETQSFTMSSMLSSMDSPVDTPSSDTEAHGPPSIARSPFTMPETIVYPKGKYYPSNYTSSPTTPAQDAPSLVLNGGNLHLPIKNQRQKSPNPKHQRQSSDVKRKLQKYQRDMIEQARMVHAQVVSSPRPSVPASKPVGPRLHPLGSPGPITPFELEEDSGYLIAGQIRSDGSVDGALRKSEAIESMIRVEEERRRREGQSSPAARV